MGSHSHYSQSRLDERQVAELIGMARGIVADGELSDPEIECLHKWCLASGGLTKNPVVGALAERVSGAMKRGGVDERARAGLLSDLEALTSSDFEVGEALKSSTLPLCRPAPNIEFDGRRFAFTGSFVFGPRKACETAVEERGGVGGSLRRDTSYLVIGEYANDDWAQSSYGRKIEKAMSLRAAGAPLRIVSEAHWRSSL